MAGADAGGCLLEDNPSTDDLGGGCLLEDNPSLDCGGGGCLLEENPVLDSGMGGLCLQEKPEEDELCLLEENHVPEGAPKGAALPLTSLNDSDGEDDNEEIEIPYADSLPEADELDVLLVRRGDEPMGVVLDLDNFVVAVRPGTPAESCGKLMPGDELLTLNGVPCSAELPAGELIRRLPLPPRGLYRLRLRRPAVLGRNLPGGAQVAAQLEAQRRALAPDGPPQPTHNPMPDMEACRAEAEAGGMDSQTKRQLQRMWHSHARKPLADRLAAAEMLRAEGNDHFTSGLFQKALDEYAYVLETFKYEMANVARNQQDAELGDLGRGLGSNDMPRIQAVRVPCLLNSAAARLRLSAQQAEAEAAAAGDTEPTAPAGLQPAARGAASKALLMQALEDVAEALRARPAAPVRAKAHFRAAQAHAGLENWREAWSAASLARELQPGSAEIKALQLQVQREMRLLQRSERESKRQGAFGTDTNADILRRDERREFRSRLALAHRLLPPAGQATAGRRQEAEAVLEKAAASGWSQLSPAEQATFEELFKAGMPSLSQAEVRRGREEGVFPPRDQERVFGANLPLALTGQTLQGPLGWLSRPQLQRARGLAAEIISRGAEQLDHDQRRFAEGLGLLAPTDGRCGWHAAPLGNGGAVLLLSPARQHLWPFPPPGLRVERVAGAAGSADRDRAVVGAWERAVADSWEWLCLVSDEAEYLGGPALQLASVLQHVAASATDARRDWQLVLLSPPGIDAPAAPGAGLALATAAADGETIGETGWRVAGPTRRPLGWIFRASLLRLLLEAHRSRQPAAGHLDVWVWEQIAERRLLGLTLAPETPLLVARRSGMPS